MKDFHNRIHDLDGADDSQIEREHSIQRRGLFGHYIAGLIRIIARPITLQYLILYGRWLEFIWGMPDVSLLVKRQSQRYTYPLLRAFGATVGEGALGGEGMWVLGVHRARFEPLKIGRDVIFGRDLMVDLGSNVEFGDYCAIGDASRYFSHIDWHISPLTANLFPPALGSIRIGRGAFIGPNTVVGKNVIIGENAVIGANSVITKHVPPHVMAGGVPAKFVKMLPSEKLPDFPHPPFVKPLGTTPEDFPYDDPRALKIPENAGMIG